MNDTVLAHLRDLISEYEARMEKFTTVMFAIQAGAPAGELVQSVVSVAASELGEDTPEVMSDEVAETMVFTMGMAANAALNDLRFLEVLATSGEVSE